VVAEFVAKDSPLGVDTFDFFEYETKNANSPIDDSPLVVLYAFSIGFVLYRGFILVAVRYIRTFVVSKLLYLMDY
jgi:hypothetical protein